MIMTAEITLISLAILIIAAATITALITDTVFVVVEYKDRSDWHYKPVKASSIYSKNKRDIEFYVSKKTAMTLRERDSVIVNGKYKGIIIMMLT